MAYHDWSDKTHDWDGISDCCHILEHYSRRYGRFGGQIKEKFGQVRFYAMLGRPSLHGLIYPGYMYKHKRFPQWLWSLDIFYISPLLDRVFGRAIYWWQSKVYEYAYKKCLKKYPHLAAEILGSADFPELIKGATRQEDTETERVTVIQWNGKDLARWVGLK
jgi:hypothetical protein